MNNIISSLNKLKLVILPIIALICHILSVKYVYNIASNTYEKNKININIFDTLQNILPNLSKYLYHKHLYLLVFVLLILRLKIPKIYKVLYELIILFSIIIIIRSIFLISTILPKNITCDFPNLDFFHLCGGGIGYDKMFSGHFAFGFLISLILLGLKELSLPPLIILNTLHFFILISTHSHYTIDLLTSFIITLFIYQNRNMFV